MSDERVRAAERAAREDGGEASAVRLLLERLRAGTLTDHRLRLAGEAGHAAARVVLRLPAWSLPDTPDRCYDWVRRLAAIEREAGLRAAVAACRCCFTTVPRLSSGSRQRAGKLGEVAWWTPEIRPADYLAGKREFRKVERWLDDPTEEHRAAISRGRAGELLHFWRLLCLTARRWHEPEKNPPTGARTVVFCANFLSHVGVPDRIDRIRAAISREVSAWALETPVPDREATLPSGDQARGTEEEDGIGKVEGG